MFTDSYTKYGYLCERDGKAWLLQTPATQRSPMRFLLHDTAEVAKVKMDQINGRGDEELKGATISVVPVEVTVKQTGPAVS